MLCEPFLRSAFSLLVGGGAIRVAAAMLIVLAAICDRPEGHTHSDRQVRATAILPVASTPHLFTLVGVPIDMVDDGVDIHQALRGQPVSIYPASALPVARSHADPVARTGLWLPERPPRHA